MKEHQTLSLSKECGILLGKKKTVSQLASSTNNIFEKGKVFFGILDLNKIANIKRKLNIYFDSNLCSRAPNKVNVGEASVRMKRHKDLTGLQVLESDLGFDRLLYFIPERTSRDIVMTDNLLVIEPTELWGFPNL